MNNAEKLTLDAVQSLISDILNTKFPLKKFPNEESLLDLHDMKTSDAFHLENYFKKNSINVANTCFTKLSLTNDFYGKTTFVVNNNGIDWNRDLKEIVFRFSSVNTEEETWTMYYHFSGLIDFVFVDSFKTFVFNITGFAEMPDCSTYIYQYKVDITNYNQLESLTTDSNILFKTTLDNKEVLFLVHPYGHLVYQNKVFESLEDWIYNAVI